MIKYRRDTNDTLNLHKLMNELGSDLVVLFKKTWGTEPLFACRAPGRVNVIGEHIDYHGFSVLPMATEADVSTI